MERSEAEGFLQTVESMYNRTFQSNAKKDLVEKLLNEPMSGAIASLKSLEARFDMLPTPIVLLKVIRDHAAQRRQADSDMRKKALPDRLPESKHDDEYIKRCSKLTLAVMSGVMSRSQILEGFRVMESTYPGRGWALQGSALDRFYKDGNHELSEKPKTHLYTDA